MVYRSAVAVSRSALRRFVVVVPIAIGLVTTAYGMRRVPIAPQTISKFDENNLREIVSSWFSRFEGKRYRACWDVVYSIVGLQPEKDVNLLTHHTSHHTIDVKSKKSLPFGDSHDIRVQYTDSRPVAKVI